MSGYMNSRALYSRLLRYVRPHWRMFALSITGMALSALTEAALPALMKPMLDGTFVTKDPTLMNLVPIALIAIFIVRGVSSYISVYGISWVGNRLVKDLRSEMFRKLLSLPTKYYDDHATGNLVSKLTFDVTQVASAATSVVTIVVKDSLIILGLVAWLLYLNWKLTLISLTLTPIMAFIVIKFAQRLRRNSREAQKTMGDMTQVLGETVDGQRVVKIFGGQQYEANRFADGTERAFRFNLKQDIASAATTSLVHITAAVAVAIIVYLATQQSLADKTTVGEFVSFILAMMMLLGPLKRLTDVNAQIQRGLSAAESVFALIDESSESDHGKTVIGRANGELEFDQVNFHYRDPGKTALSDINLHVAPGETVALVGASGSGKTTLVNLIPRFYSPTSGLIKLDGKNVSDLTLASLRANIALVSQDVVLFNDTLAANIAYGSLANTSEADVIRAAEAAHAMEFVRALPDGLQTMIGEKGLRLSGGQRQRLAIARALLKNAPILILDEATSALDSESERHVQAALETLMQGRTTIVIAHRLSTIEKSDRIVVLDDGRIVEIGRHSELIARDGLYAKLHRIQFQLAATQR
ncbi:MAG: lipid A export permease/ATP-binding protein MsbA [Burkholderiales bacterium]